MADEADLLAEVRDMFWRADPVPASVIEAARASYDWRSLDTQLARLTADSALAATADVRGEPARLLTFEADGCAIDVEVADVGGRLRVLGQLVPPRPARLRVEQPAGSLVVTADSLGRFTVRDLAPGLTRFVVEHTEPDPPTDPIHTEWIKL